MQADAHDAYNAYVRALGESKRRTKTNGTHEITRKQPNTAECSRTTIVNMADGGLLVTISGAALSLLLYENVRSPGDQMGFLLGETLQFVEKEFTDADTQVETIKIHINVETVVMCPLPDLLHDSSGKINKARVKEFLRDKSKHVVGWFRFRRNAPLSPTLRDKILHKQFSSYFSDVGRSTEEFFLTCLLSSSTTNQRGTHKYRHVFLRHKRGIFEPIPLRINNLGDGASRHDGSDYKPTPAFRSVDEADPFDTMLKSLKLNFMLSHSIEAVTNIERAAENHLDELIPQVCRSDREVTELEKQVLELKAKIFEHDFLKKLKAIDRSDTTGSNYNLVEDNDTNEDRTADKNDNSPHRIRYPGRNFDIDPLSKDYSYPTAQHVASRKTRNTAVSLEKSLSTDKPRSVESTTEAQGSSSQDSFTNVTSEKKLNICESVPNKNRRSNPVESEIARQPICTLEQNGGGRGRGRGRGSVILDAKGSRRWDTSTAPLCTGRSVTKPAPSTESESVVSNSVQNAAPSRPSYGQVAKRNLTK